MFTFCKARWARREKSGEKNHATKVTKIPKTKRQIYGMNKTVVIKIFYPDICKKKISPPLKIKKYLQNAEKFAHFFSSLFSSMISYSSLFLSRILVMKCRGFINKKNVSWWNLICLFITREWSSVMSLLTKSRGKRLSECK